MVVLLPKGNGNYRRIGLTWVLWKNILGAINPWIRAEIIYYDVLLHGLWLVRGNGTDSLEANMLQQLKKMREESLYKFFLNLIKVHDTLYREQCMEIIIAYRLRPQKECLLWHYWEGLNIVARAGHYYGYLFKGSGGVMQGNPMSSTIFNMVIDVLICQWDGPVLVCTLFDIRPSFIGARLKN